MDNELLKNLGKLHTTELGVVRIKRNLYLTNVCWIFCLFFGLCTPHMFMDIVCGFSGFSAIPPIGSFFQKKDGA